jgi:prepilin signal peptidase PulO-like enzyme (type II secretory pathway)
MSQLFRIIVLFILWTIFGSFGWVLISREWTKQWIRSILFGRSKCDKCGKTLTPLELVPILSFFIQHWRCKSCKTKLPNFYRIIELVCGCVFAMTYIFFPYWDIWQLCFRLAINRWLTFLVFCDIIKYELHMPFWIFTTFVALSYGLLNYFKWSILLCLLFLCIFVCIYFFAKFYVKIRYKQTGEWFWVWDVYLSATIWLLFVRIFVYNGIDINLWNISSMILVYIVLSCLLWLVYTIIERFVSNRKGQRIPFLPAMIICFRILLLFWVHFINLF